MQRVRSMCQTIEKRRLRLPKRQKTTIFIKNIAKNEENSKKNEKNTCNSVKNILLLNMYENKIYLEVQLI